MPGLVTCRTPARFPETSCGANRLGPSFTKHPRTVLLPDEVTDYKPALDTVDLRILIPVLEIPQLRPKSLPEFHGIRLHMNVVNLSRAICEVGDGV